MKLIATDEFAANPRKILRQLQRDGGVIIVENGAPKGILTPTSAGSLVEDMQAQIRDRARRAVSEIRRQAARRRLDRLGMTEVNREIAAARKARRSRLGQ